MTKLLATARNIGSWVTTNAFLLAFLLGAIPLLRGIYVDLKRYLPAPYSTTIEVGYVALPLLFSWILAIVIVPSRMVQSHKRRKQLEKDEHEKREKMRLRRLAMEEALREAVSMRDYAGAIACYAHVPQPPRYAVQRVFYATDRQLGKSQRPWVTYEPDRTDRRTLFFGTCKVSIPHDHRIGRLEGRNFLRLQFWENPLEHVVLLQTSRFGSRQFFRKLNASVASSPRKELFVFIHGYNVTFRNAARRTAQIAYDLQFAGAPVLYSWPSEGRSKAYPTDETNVEWTVLHLKWFLNRLQRESGAEVVHLIAHSMGNRALTNALKLMAIEGTLVRGVFRQIVLTAPDIDVGVFKQLASHIKAIGERVTFYASENDRALMLSKKFHGYPRAGESLLVLPGIDTVDASSVDTSLVGHSYYGENRSVLSDIFSLIHHGKEPTQRFGMSAVQVLGGVYYRLKP